MRLSSVWWRSRSRWVSTRCMPTPMTSSWMDSAEVVLDTVDVEATLLDLVAAALTRCGTASRSAASMATVNAVGRRGLWSMVTGVG